MTVKELKKLAKAQGVKGYSRMRKAELEKILNVPATPATLTVKVLRQLAKANGIKGYSKMRKSELLAIINAQPVTTIKTKSLEELEADLRKAFEKHAFIACNDRAKIFDLRKELDCSFETFDALIRKLRDEDKFYPLTGDKSLEADEEFKFNFVDENNFRYSLLQKAV